MNDRIDINEKFGLFSEQWRPKLIAELNGQEVKLAKLLGEFVWHKHDVDEMFLVWCGTLKIEMRDSVVELKEGQMYVVPAGVEHRPIADDEVELILFEPAGVVNTGGVFDEEKTAPTIERI